MRRPERVSRRSKQMLLSAAVTLAQKDRMRHRTLVAEKTRGTMRGLDA